MKIIIFNADTSQGRLFAMKFRRAGHRVVSTHQQEQSNDRELISMSKDGVYQAKFQEKIADVLKYESPEMIVYLHSDAIRTEEDARKEIAMMTLLTQESATQTVKKFLYLSSLEVYGNEQRADKNENTIPNPVSLAGRTMIACENLLNSFRNEEHLLNVIFRIGETWAEDNLSEDVSSILYAVNTGDSLTEELAAKEIIPVSQGDLADAVLKSINENVHGIYDICGLEVMTGSELYNKLAEKIGSQVMMREVKPVTFVPSCKKALHEIGWVQLHETKEMLDMLVKQTLVDEPVRVVKGKLVGFKSKNFQNFVAHTFLFGLVAAGQQLSPLDLGVDPLLIYIIAAAAFGGISHGIYASLLTIGYHIYEMGQMGYGPSALILHYTFLIDNLLYVTIALTVGYVIERKNSALLKMKTETVYLSGENSQLYEINGELATSKQYQEQKLVGYENGISKLYTVFESLEMKSVTEVLFNIPKVFKELTGERNISIYIIQKQSGFMRRFVFTGKPSTIIPSTFRYVNMEGYKRVIDMKEVYLNRYLDSEMPSIIVPIVVNEEVIAITVIEDYPFEKFTRYYLNLIQISGKIINSFGQKAAIRQEFISEIIYEDITTIMKKSFFKASYETALKASKETTFHFAVLEIKASDEDQKKVDKIRSVLRDVDEIGRLENGNIGILLYGANNDNIGVIQDRIKSLGIESSVL
ncbi:NAD-dependent epimerase/dehydratase family protein [Trichococcus collinsii]|uniref:Nucleoside-diphosphate-sugar epimerase n=1 Tax=Trichococcus collinsii TaxID=157076 RepID=A0AB38A0X8_9LACT|nr:NAD(P)-dependent oxidoreductase [Trichococcus collinsii]CZQ91610.1 Hypothetical protein Tcol_1121 [Trichococcus collinsii]SEA55488.1 Nucleoside-diphosphate-sugar epimerase [Trichococcus collinsii]